MNKLDEDARKVRKHTWRYIFHPVFVALFLCGSCCAAFWLSEFPHDRRLDEYELEFKKIEHPPGTTLVKMEKRVGLLGIGGNACRYFVGELREYLDNVRLG